MASLKEKINNNLKEAMKNKDGLAVSVLRLLVSAIKNKEIMLRQTAAELDDEQIVEVISSEIKKRKDSIVAYEQGGRHDLAEKEKKETGILEKYLPPRLSDEEIEKIVREIATADGGKNFGAIMGRVMAKVKGKADGIKVGEIVKRVLAS